MHLQITKVAIKGWGKNSSNTFYRLTPNVHPICDKGVCDMVHGRTFIAPLSQNQSHFIYTPPETQTLFPEAAIKKKITFHSPITTLFFIIFFCDLTRSQDPDQFKMFVQDYLEAPNKSLCLHFFHNLRRADQAHPSTLQWGGTWRDFSLHRR